MTRTVNYVICCWPGTRNQGQDEHFTQDRSFYLKVQLAQLKRLKHNLKQITFVTPICDQPQREDLDFFDKLPEYINDTKIEILTDHYYYGWSYGSFAYAVRKFNNFDYFVFCEDDYVPVIDNFDQELISIMQSQNENVKYLASFVALTHEDQEPHAAISNGIIKGQALRTIRKRYGKINHENQVEFSYGFNRAGFSLADMTFKFRAPFWMNYKIHNYADENERDLWVPVQLYVDPDLREKKSDWEENAVPLETFKNSSYWKLVA